jgi:hypothetical protein
MSAVSFLMSVVEFILALAALATVGTVLFWVVRRDKAPRSVEPPTRQRKSNQEPLAPHPGRPLRTPLNRLFGTPLRPGNELRAHAAAIRNELWSRFPSPRPLLLAIVSAEQCGFRLSRASAAVAPTEPIAPFFAGRALAPLTTPKARATSDEDPAVDRDAHPGLGQFLAAASFPQDTDLTALLGL